MAIQVMKQIMDCLDSKKNFLLSGGAGSGKTYTLIQTLNHIFNINSTARVACITYTNVASDEIKERSPFSNLFVSTIHDFLWVEIKDYQKNLKESVINLLRNGTIKYSGDTDVNDLVFDNIQYKNYRKIENGIISHDDMHYKNMKKLNNYAIERGVRDKLIFIAGGTQVSNELAVANGMDAGFGRGTKGSQVATFLVKKRREMQNED